MRKSEKRKIGEAKQAANREQSIKSGLLAQQKAHEHRAEKQKLLMREKARKDASVIINGVHAKAQSEVGV